MLSGHSNAVEGAGNVVWTDDSRRTGGLSFTEFPEEIREQIRHWPLLTQLPLEPFAGKTVSKAPALHYGVPYVAGGVPEVGPGTYYRQYFPEEASPEIAAGKPGWLLNAVKISCVAIMIGVVSFLAYRGAQKSSANSKAAGPQSAQVESRGDSDGTNTPSPSSNSSGEVALPQSNGETSDVRGEALPSVSPAANAKAEQQPSNAGQAGLNQTPIRHETEASQPLILVVQVAAVAQEADAYKVLNALKQKHFAAFISPPVNDQLYRVQLGPYQTVEAARAGVQALEKAGYKPFIVLAR